MPSYGLIGYPLSHSFSKQYFEQKFHSLKLENLSYELYPIPNISELTSLIADNPQLSGLNVTIPYKQKVIPFLNKLDPAAEKIHAINTIKIIRSENKSFSLVGFNTDAPAFLQSIKPLIKPHHTKALILGTGGASKAVAHALAMLNIEFTFVSRNPSITNSFDYQCLDKRIISEHTVIVNTTPLGMYPYKNTFPQIPYEFITDKHIVYDLIYNPGETVFLKKAKQYNAVTKSGLQMLHLQADLAWNIWNE